MFAFAASQVARPSGGAKPTAPTPRTIVQTQGKAPVKTAAKRPVATRRTLTAKKAPVRRRTPLAPARLTDQHPQLEDLPPMSAPLMNLEHAELADSFFHRRGRGLHYAIDIMRPIGDPLYAVVDGVVQQLAWSPRGGRSVYLTDRDGQYRFFYCHLSKYADGLKAGDLVQRGDLIGYVGNTGNARYSAPHLHFEIVRLVKSSATAMISRVVNPYPILRQLLDAPPVPPLPPLPVLTHELIVSSNDQK